ncbi:hypothetical protein Trco_004743 [Trichoderma cornu-damae]|uniref:EGF-like domain-containing protein n=1 Tax=Trichoderma cornu-damae TaxID=654480 RepID=A0A9P8QHV1_9HYPO|nr:hypothetical protein Trco_004743 [Trichoderma cornu-damae]
MPNHIVHRLTDLEQPLKDHRVRARSRGPESPLEQVESPSSDTSAPPRRSAILGPPPSSRRGQSSFYSAASFVSPIPEEDSAYKSHNSYASSAAMPDGWRAESVVAGPGFHGRAFYEESWTDGARNSGSDEYGDESGLVSGRDEYALQTLSSPQSGGKKPAPANPFDWGAGLADESTDASSSLSFANRQTPATTPGMASHIAAVPLNTSNMSSPGDLRKVAGSPPPTSRLSAIRRPPRLDIDAVREAESRGSLTSLPDLIRRATRLASMIDKGKRPSSRLDELDFFDEKAGRGDGMKRPYDDRYQSGLSDMLAAFPPPVQTPQHTGYGPVGSWPSLPGHYAGREKFSVTPDDEPPADAKAKGRRCCGLPAWGFVLVVLLMLCIIAAAVVVPLEYFVFKNLGNHDKSTSVNLETCAKTLPCLNGGSAVVINNTCSCICTNGFTGANCDTSGSAGCTTTNLVPTDGSSHVNNVTLGMAIPRIIADAQKSFSIPLLGTSILARFNTANLSCIAQNALVTFDGQSTRTDVASAKVQRTAGGLGNAKEETRNDSEPTPDLGSRQLDAVQGEAPALVRRDSPSTSSSAPSPEQTGMFTVTQEVLDFARTAVLYVLQEDSVDAANTAQTQLQQFFSQATQAITKYGSEVTVKEASSISIGGNRTVDLVDTMVDIGQGPVGGKNASKRSVFGGF